ncbi:MAG TPA: epoxyqueuosine reductase QueH [Sulfuricurvum sp.]|nr:MAG: diacylglucosamine hydrolase like protein [Campylobacterales bacterium 16-40-21]OZA02263.1 MAG: diacylglucosamine hydrolase like protein [Sulfuricurvum sp. 17-40-25]HQS67664.1 epoxyqueuosine reductase QueH [Sulfuricurvum sp.]HQT37712.1 epoxyqueuosine reductase QueH [Sulfuricurvum sp.]
MLVHICCSVDSHFFMEKLQQEYPDEKLTGFFYDPNIHPYSEYQLRLLDVERSCKKLGIELIEGQYDFEDWMDAVRGLEKEPEKGARCEVCFDRRFEVSAHKALELGETSMTTTLLVSPQKSQDQLKKSGDAFHASHGVEFIAFDYRKNGGTNDQSKVSKEEQLYRQDYCGCIFGLTMQRDQQHKLMDEMFSPLSKQTLSASIEERLALYAKRMDLEDAGITYKIIRERFLNYRLMRASLKTGGEMIPSYPLLYSTINRTRTEGKIDFELDGQHFLNREEVRFITIETFNTLTSSEYKNTQELMFNAPTCEVELSLRMHLCKGMFNTSAIIVVDEIPTAKVILTLETKSYEDTRERLIF